MRNEGRGEDGQIQRLQGWVRKYKPVGTTKNLPATQLAAYPLSQKQHRLILRWRSTFLTWGRRLDPQPLSKAGKTMRKTKTTPPGGSFSSGTRLSLLQVFSHPKFYLLGYFFLISENACPN